MDIHLHDTYYLTSDRHQFILYQKIVSQKGKYKGELYDTNHRFFPDVKSAFNYLFERELINNLKDATELQQVLLALTQTQELIMKTIDKLKFKKV